MRDQLVSHYCNRVPPCKHICLTVITCGVLLSVGCKSDRPIERPPATQKSDRPAPPPSAPPTAAKPAVSAHQWQSLFDGKSLKGWKPTDFAGHGEVTVEKGSIILEQGVMTGVTWTNDLPRMNYEIALDAMRVDGSDFFCGLTFPVGDDPCSFIAGGWGGGVVGLSSLDGEDAANNETTKVQEFQKGRWYAVRVRVMPTQIQAWIDEEKLVDVITTDRRISIRPEVELSKPLGIASYSTTAALRNIRIRKL